MVNSIFDLSSSCVSKSLKCLNSQTTESQLDIHLQMNIQDHLHHLMVVRPYLLTVLANVKDLAPF